LFLSRFPFAFCPLKYDQHASNERIHPANQEGGGIHFPLALILAAIRPNETRDWAAHHITRRRQSKAIDLAGTPCRSRIICVAFPLFRFSAFPLQMMRH